MIINTRQITKDWAVVQATPDPSILESLAVRDTGTVISLLKDKNEIWLGQPEVFYLQDIVSEKNTLLSSVLHTHDLILIQLSVSFRPSPYCEFIRSSIKLNARYIDTNIQQKPSVFDMFPKEVMMPVTFKRTLSIAPTLKLDFAKVAQVEVSAFELSNAKDYLIYQPEITAYKGDGEFGWDFNHTSSRKLTGMKDLFVVIKRQISEPMSISLSIFDCYVQTNLVGKIPLSTLFLSGGGTQLEKEFTVP